MKVQPPQLERHRRPWLPMSLLAVGWVVCAGCEIGSELDSASGQLTYVQEETQPTTVRVANSGGAIVKPNRTGPGDSPSVPDWAADAIFYQIFPERFRNGDPTNDPTRESLEFPDNVSDDWAVTPWTGDWYARAKWEKQRGENFYEDGVFDRRYGGDLQGVIDRLDYLKQLGVNAIYLNPVFYARSLHKYDGNTFHHIDPHFGPDPAGDFKLLKQETSDPKTWQWTAADRLFLKLIAEAHRRDLRVIIDGVFNHTGRNFFAFEDLVRRQADSPYRDWYVVHAFDDPDTPANEFRYKGWWGVDTLPEFADTPAGDDLHSGPKRYVWDATRRWMDPNADGDPSDGIDGWRLDVAAEVPIKFWNEWNGLCRQINPECYTVAEFWEDASRFLVEGGFSATMNYYGFAFPVKGYLVDDTMSASDVGEALTNRMEEFPTAIRYAVQNLIDSHDTDRVASMIVNAPVDRPYLQPQRADYDVGERVSPRNWREYDVRKPTEQERRIQRLVALMQATFVGPPMIYYGTEAGMWGADDPCDRMPMVWDDLEFATQTHHPLGKKRPADDVSFDRDLHAYYQALFKLRTGSDALRRGDFQVAAANDEAHILAFRRTSAAETVCVVFNRDETPGKITIDTGKAGRWVTLLSTSGQMDNQTIQAENGRLVVSLPGLEGIVLQLRPAAE